MFSSKLEKSIGATCEIRSLKNDLYFIGRITEFDGRALTIMETSGNALPPIIYNTEIKLHVYAPDGEKLIFQGHVHGNGRTIWKIGALVDLKMAERREYFRQPILAKGVVLRVNKLHTIDMPPVRYEPAVSCVLLDVSYGGVLIQCEQAYLMGDWLALMNISLLDEELPFAFLCKVRRVETIDRITCQYGCEFVNITQAERDRLCRCIFTIQRLEMQKRRERR